MHHDGYYIIIQAYLTVTARERGGGYYRGESLPGRGEGGIIEVSPHLGLNSKHALQRALLSCVMVLL